VWEAGDGSREGGGVDSCWRIGWGWVVFLHGLAIHCIIALILAAINP